jgi:hypothetical protein
MNTYIIKDAKTLPLLIKEVSKYDISTLGSLVVLNGHYFQSFIGTQKDTPEVILRIPKGRPIETKGPTATNTVKVKSKPKSRAKKSTKVTKEKEDVPSIPK